ncbi:MAG: tetratricopeptide repeat protein [Caldilineaceae bacterium]
MGARVAVTPVGADTYVDLFTEYVIGGVRASLAQVRAHEYAAPDDVRRQAWHVLSFALDVNAAWAATKELLLELAPRMEQGGFRETWIPYLEQGIQASHLLFDEEAKAEFSFHLGMLYRLLSQHEKATTLLSASAETFARVGNPYGQAKTLNQLAYMAWQRHDMGKAEEYAQIALRLLEDTDPERAMGLSALGLICKERAKWHNDINEWRKAEAYHRAALELRNRAGDKRKIGWSLQNLADVLAGQKRFVESMQYFEQALSMMHEFGDEANRAIVCMNLGVVYYENRDYAQALQWYERARLTFENLSDSINLARCCLNSGLNYLALNNSTAAEKSFQNAAGLYKKAGNESMRLNATDGLALALLAQVRYQEAYNLLLEASADLEQIVSAPIYGYLQECFEAHMAQAKEGLAKQTA